MLSRLKRLHGQRAERQAERMTRTAHLQAHSSTHATCSLDTPAHPRPRAPLQVEFRFRLNLPPSEAFGLVSVRLPEWFQRIHAVSWNHTRSNGGQDTLGSSSERVCNFDGKNLIETIVDFEPGRRYSYRVDMARSEMKLPLRDHLGVFEVEPSGAGSLVTWRQYFRLFWFVPGPLLRWQMRDRLMRPSVSGLLQKYGGEWVSVK